MIYESTLNTVFVISLTHLIGATRVAVLVVLDEGQEPVEGRRTLDDVLDTVALVSVL